MKIINKLLLFVALTASVILLSSCNLADSLTTLPVNIPISVNFSTGGNNSTVAGSSEFCLENNETFQKYQDKIKKIKIVKIAIRTVSYSPQDMKGDLNVSVKDDQGNVLFSESLTDINPGDYINTPFEFTLSASEIEAFDNYLQSVLDANRSICFTGSLNLQITNGNAPYVFNGALDVVFEAETEL